MITSVCYAAFGHVGALFHCPIQLLVFLIHKKILGCGLNKRPWEWPCQVSHKGFRNRDKWFCQRREQRGSGGKKKTKECMLHYHSCSQFSLSLCPFLMPFRRIALFRPPLGSGSLPMSQKGTKAKALRS